MTQDERQKTMELAFGRILRMGSRPTQPGDVGEYERCRAIILDIAVPVSPDYRPNWAAQRSAGAQGD